MQSSTDEAQAESGVRRAPHQMLWVRVPAGLLETGRSGRPQEAARWGPGRGCFPNNNPSGLSRIASNNPSAFLVIWTPSDLTPAKPCANLFWTFQSFISISAEVFKASQFLNTRSSFSVQHEPRELDPSKPSLGSREAVATVAGSLASSTPVGSRVG